jgi:hypothetical protein
VSMIRLLPRWCLLGLAVCVGGVAPASAQFALRADTLPVNDVGSGPGELHGVVHDDRGVPLEGATVSILGAASAFRVSDRHGRFGFRGLPPGTYLVRVYLEGYLSGRPRSVPVAPELRAIWRISLTRRVADDGPHVLSAGIAPIGGSSVAPAEDAGDREPSELAWRLRHAPRSVLKDSQGLVPEGGDRIATAARVPAQELSTALFADLSLNGQVNLLTTASFDRPQDLFAPGADTPRPIAYLSLVAPASGGEWTFRGAITQGDLASWILAGSFVRRGEGRHEYEAGLSYSMQRYEGGNADALASIGDGSRNVGAIYAHDTWTMSPRVSVSYGARLAEYDYLDSGRVLVSPQASVVIRPLRGETFRVRASVAHRESAPGAEEFLPPAAGVTLPPERTFSPVGDQFRPERLDHFEVAAERRWTGDLVIGVRTFRQQVRDQMVTLFGISATDGQLGIGHYYVGSGGAFDAEGWGVSVSRPLGDHVDASIDYTLVDATWVAWSSDAPLLATRAGSLLRTVDRIHDVTASVQHVMAPTSTRIVALYKLNSAFAGRTADAAPGTSARFNVQVTQSLPFLAATGAQWEMIVAVSNLFRDELTSGSVYDELLVLKPPTRMLGGVNVRF